MSQLNVDTIKDRTGGDTGEYVGVNTAKAWVTWGGNSGNTQNDYGFDSVTDVGTGVYDFAFTTAFSSADDYTLGITVYDGATGATVGFESDNVNKTTTGFRCATQRVDDLSQRDADVDVVIHGD